MELTHLGVVKRSNVWQRPHHVQDGIAGAVGLEPEARLSDFHEEQVLALRDAGLAEHPFQIDGVSHRFLSVVGQESEGDATLLTLLVNLPGRTICLAHLGVNFV